MSRSGAGKLTGTGTLFRLALRRDRVLLPAIVLGLALLAVGSAQASLALYPTAGSLQSGLSGALANPALKAMYGPVTDPTSPDSFAVYKTVIMGAIFLALACYAMVRRHTRTEEEEGRLELIGAGVVGRRAPLTAAVLLSLLMVAASCTVTVFGMIGLGMQPLGTVTFGLGWAGVGIAMTGITAVAAQVTTTARGCGAIAVGALGLAFLLRAVGDAVPGAGWLTWLSFLGWAELMSPYGGNHVAVFVLLVLVGAALLAAAYLLLERRDLGAGLLATRPGRSRGGSSLASPLGLAWRLQRGSLLGWSVGILFVGALVGSIAGQMEQLLSDPGLRDMLAMIGGGADTLTDMYFAAEFAIVALAISAYGIGATLRLRGEERHVHAETILSTATSRWRWLASHLVIALAGTAWLLMLMGVSTGLVHGLASGDLGWTVRLGAAALGPLPAVWVCVSLTLLVFGVAPRWTSAAWLALVLFLVVGELGSILGLPTWVSDLSPFTHLPKLPAGAFALTPFAAVAGVATVMLLSGSTGFRRRDVG